MKVPDWFVAFAGGVDVSGSWGVIGWTAMLLIVAQTVKAEFRVKWSYSGSKPASAIGGISASDSVCDLNGGAAELIGINDARTGIGIHDGATGAVLFSSPAFSGNVVQVACSDVDGDGLKDVVLAYTGPAGIMVIGWSGVSTEVPVQPDGSPGRSQSLNQNTPNPFDAHTGIDFAIAQPAEIDLSIYDPSGRVVRHLADGVFDAGLHTEVWDGRNENGQEVPAGTYFYRLAVDGAQVGSKKAVLMR